MIPDREAKPRSHVWLWPRQLNWILGAISISALHPIFQHILYKSKIRSALVFHEYILTVVPEIERFWPKRLRSFFFSEDYSDNHGLESRKDNNFTLASFLFFLNRYFTVAAHIPIAVRLFFTGNVEVSLPWAVRLVLLDTSRECTRRTDALYSAKESDPTDYSFQCPGAITFWLIMNGLF